MPINTININDYSDRIIHNTEVDFNQRIIVKPIHIMQYDNDLPIIAVTLMKNGSLYTIPNDAVVYFRWGKKDHTFIIKEVLGCDSARHTVYFEVDKNMAIFYGSHTPIIEVQYGGHYEGSGDDRKYIVHTAGSSYIQVEIDRNPVQDGDVESTTEYDKLEAAVKDAQDAAESALESKEYVEYYKDQAVEAINEAAEQAAEVVSHAINTFEIGQDGQTTPSAELVVGGIFYQKQ